MEWKCLKIPARWTIILILVLIFGLLASALVPVSAFAAGNGTLMVITRDASKKQIAAPIYVDNVQKGTGKVTLKVTTGKHEVKFGDLAEYTLISPKGGKITVQVKAARTTMITAAYKKSSSGGDTTAPTTTPSPAGGTFTSAQTVTLACADNTGGAGCGATYYTIDGSDPTASSSVYSAPISISATTTLKFFSKDSVGNQETVKTETYTITLLYSAGPQVTDIDGNVYNSVIIGTQTWMKENLKVTKYRNGDAIPTTTPRDISGETSPQYQWAHNNEGDTATYGRLYTWYAATDSRGACPASWHLPSDAEWTTLTDYMGGVDVAGGKMKEAGTTHWRSPNYGADNSSGFTGLPGGYYQYDFYYGNHFTMMGESGCWLSATVSYEPTAWTRELFRISGDVGRHVYVKYIGYSVRCVKD
ncbi:MAG: chitobiase/beta-hexosaminidase C-terminal domain-containing protein [Nitrospinae bacterium]|nr:chitobiase/beta-hexosaminidase C-terminal domain-containing protein [Nitrospinota bacterium]